MKDTGKPLADEKLERIAQEVAIVVDAGVDGLDPFERALLLARVSDIVSRARRQSEEELHA